MATPQHMSFDLSGVVTLVPVTTPLADFWRLPRDERLRVMAEQAEKRLAAAAAEKARLAARPRHIVARDALTARWADLRGRLADAATAFRYGYPEEY